MSYVFHNFEVPVGFSAISRSKLSDAFVIRARYFEHGPMPSDCWDDTDPRAKPLLKAVCETGCDVPACGRCLNNLRFIRVAELRDIARFEAMERWMRLNHGLPEDYRRPQLWYRSRCIPGNLHDHADLVGLFREVDRDSAACWCNTGKPCDHAPQQHGISCAECIYCNNCEATHRYRERADAFAEYATACGYVVDSDMSERSVEENAPVKPPANIISATFTYYEPLLPTVERPPAIPESRDYRKVLELFNKGYACWCDPQQTCCPGACNRCGLAAANAHSVDVFAMWAKSNGWSVERPQSDSYTPEVLQPPEKPKIDYSMATDSIDDPYVCPRLQAAYIVGLDVDIRSGLGSNDTRWLLVWGPAGSAGDYNCVALDETDGQVRLGYGYALSATWHSLAGFTISVEHISSVHPMRHPAGHHSFANYGDVLKIMRGRSEYAAWVRAEE